MSVEQHGGKVDALKLVQLQVDRSAGRANAIDDRRESRRP
jgi:hypothetical protein